MSKDSLFKATMLAELLEREGAQLDDLLGDLYRELDERGLTDEYADYRFG